MNAIEWEKQQTSPSRGTTDDGLSKLETTKFGR